MHPKPPFPPESPTSSAAAPDDAALLRRMLDRSPLDPTRTRWVFENFFRGGPRLVLRQPLARYSLGARRVLDAGCGYGASLLYFGPGSLGLELDSDASSFARAIGLPVAQLDVQSENFATDVPDAAFDVVWCCAVLEHVESPHTFLVRLRDKLASGGLVILTVPTIPRSRLSEAAAKLVFRIAARGRPRELSYTSRDHINGFSDRSFTFMVERAGFQVLQVTAGLPPLGPLNRLEPLLVGRWDRVTVVARKIDDFDYGPKTVRKIVKGGWRYKTPEELAADGGRPLE